MLKGDEMLESPEHFKQRWIATVREWETLCYFNSVMGAYFPPVVLDNGELLSYMG